MRNPNTVDGAILAMRTLQIHLGNSRSGLMAADRMDAFLSWCEDQARPQLEHLFEPTEDLLGELESVYHRLALAPDMSERKLNGLLDREYALWDQRLRQVEEELQRTKKLADRVGAPVVLDTSVLMEGEPFLTFDWHTLDPILAAGPVRLILPILAVDELDELLHDRDGARRQKARTATRELWHLHRTKPTEPVALPGKSDVTIEIMVDGDWHQRRPNNDAEIIDQALQVQQMTGWVLLASCDLRQLYRAGAAGLPAVQMPRKDD
jgi:PIN domain